jgi:hypothetical protein
VSERKTTEIKLRVSPEEKTSWQVAADRREISLSELIRREMNWGAQQNALVDVEDSSVAQAVPTSDGADVVTKPWMFEARSGD